MYLTKRSYLLGGGALVLVAALVASAAVYGNRQDPVTVPEQTPIHVTLDQSLASNRSIPGDHFQATVSEPVIVDGKTVIPQGARAEGLVVDARKSGRLMGRARLRLALDRVQVDDKVYDLQTTSARRTGGDHKKRNIAWIAGGGGGGALIGALAAGGKGALIGGPVGAGAGTAVAYFTGEKNVRFSAETPLTFHLTAPITVEVKKS